MNILQITLPIAIKNLLNGEVEINSEVLSDNWGTVTRYAQKQVKTIEQKQKSSRNKTMHARGQFDPEVALEVLDNSVSFAEYLIQFIKIEDNNVAK